MKYTIHHMSYEKQKNLLMEMIRTDFKLRYQSSALGYIWSILKPLFLFAIMYTVFTKFLKIGAGIPNYALSLLLGLILWNFFADATAGGLKSVVAKGSLLRKIDIPRYLIPISAVASAFINMLLSFVVFTVFLIFAKDNALSIQTLWIFPIMVILLMMLTLGVVFYLSAFYVKLRDIDHIWDVVRQAFFYTIPIVYPLSRIANETYQKILILNPIAEIIQNSRAVITYEDTPTINTIFGSDLYVLIPIVMIVTIFITGFMYFNKHAKEFAERV